MKWLRVGFVVSVLLNLLMLSLIATRHSKPVERDLTSLSLALPPPAIFESEGLPLIDLTNKGEPPGGTASLLQASFGPPGITFVPTPSVPVAADCEKFVDFMLGTATSRFSPADLVDSITNCEKLPEPLAAAEAEFRRECSEAKRTMAAPTELGPIAEPPPFFLDANLSATARCTFAMEKLQTAIARNRRGETPISEVSDVRVLVRLQRAAGNTMQESEEMAKRIAELLPNDMRATTNYLDQVGNNAFFGEPEKAEKSWQEARAWVEKGRALDPSHPYIEEMDLWTRTQGFTTNVEAELADHDKRYPNSGYGAYRAGIAAAKAGDAKEAEKLFQRAVEREPRDLRYRTNLDRLRRNETVEDYNPSFFVSPDDLLPPQTPN